MNTAVITGAGVVTPIAHAPADLHQALCEGSSAIGLLSAFTTAGVQCQLGAVVDSALLRQELADRPLAGIDRMGQLTVLAARRALASATALEAPSTLGLVLGTMFSGAHTIGAFDRRAQTEGPQFASPLDFASTVLNAAAGQAAIRLSLRGANITISAGLASGLQALGYAADVIDNERTDALLAGGADELSLESYLGFGRAGMMCGTNGRPGHVPVPFDSARTGFALGEGAACVLVEGERVARRRGATLLARIAGHAAAIDPDALDRGYCGRTVIAEVIKEALARARVTPEQVDAVSASANGSYDGDAEEAAALDHVFSYGQPPAVTAIKSVLGETLGASGALQAVALVEAMHDGRLPGVHGLRTACTSALDVSASTRRVRIATALITAISPEGSCCALVLQRPGEGR